MYREINTFLTCYRSSRYTTLLAILVAAAGSVMGSFIKIPLPFSPVPITLQPLPAFLAGMYLGPVNGLISQLIYASALPYTTYSMYGISVLHGPVSGYIWGCVFSSFIVGSLHARLSTYSRSLFITVLAGVHAFVIYLPGTLILSYYLAATHGPLSVSSLISLAIVPYLFGDSLKLLITSAAR